METVTLPKFVFKKILGDVEVLLDDVEIALNMKMQQRMMDIETGKVSGKSEDELDSYLKRRGVQIG